MPRRSTALVVLVLSLAGGSVLADQRFDHPSGVGFAYPDGWTLRDLDPVLLLVPPGTPETLSSLPVEYVLIGAESVPAGVAATSPDVAAWFDQQILNVDPAASRTDEPKAVLDAAELSYLSSTAEHRVRVRVEDTLGLYVVHGVRGDASTAEHSSVFESVFASFRAQLNLDPGLVGRWYRSETAMTDVDYSDSGSAYASSRLSQTYAFQDDGRFFYSSSASVHAQGAGVGGGSVFDAPAGDPGWDGGTWAASAGAMTLLWEEGEAVECSYSVFSDHAGNPALKLQCGDADKPLFFRPS